MPKLIKKICIECKKEFIGDSRPHHKRCSLKCRNTSISWKKCRSLNAKKYIGNKNPHWKGGRGNTGKGYIWIYSPYHPFKNRQNQVLEHRLVMEKHIKRFLLPQEVVHHINGNKQDNNLKNLKIFKSHSEHISFENRLRIKK